MTTLPADASDAELLAFADRWAALLERGDYAGAYALTDHDPGQGWSADLIRHVVKSYGEADPNQRVTADGVPTDVRQRKEVTRWPTNARGCAGEVWYDLNIDGQVSDLTATFDLVPTDDGLTLRLNDIHVM